MTKIGAASCDRILDVTKYAKNFKDLKRNLCDGTLACLLQGYIGMSITQAKVEIRNATQYLETKEDWAYLGKTLVALAISPVLYVTGFRFSKDYRWDTTRFHSIVYSIVNTTAANRIAGLGETK